MDGKKGQVEKQKPSPRLRFLFAAVVLILPFVLYVDTLNAGFVWDDHILVEINMARTRAEIKSGETSFLGAMADLWAADFWRTGQAKSSQYYRPLTSSTFLLDYFLYGPTPRGFHFTNILLYSLACLAAYGCFRELLGSEWTAFATALAFVALPAHTENVAWVSGRTDIVCGLFMFASFYLYLVADRRGGAFWRVGSVLLFLLSLFGKEMSITMPAAVALHQAAFHGMDKRSLGRAALSALPFAAAAAAFWGLHQAMAPHPAQENVYLDAESFAASAIRNLGLGVVYSLWPGGFELLVTATREQAARTFPAPGGWMLAAVSLPLLGATGLALAAVLKKWPLILFGLASGLVSLVPVSGLVPIGVIFAARFLFIPSFFFWVFAGGALEKILGEREFPLVGAMVPAAAAVFLPIFLFFSAATWIAVPKWKSDETLMLEILEAEPDSALAHFLLGNAVFEQGRIAEAAAHFERAIELRPGYAQAEYNLGVISQRRGDVARAETYYRMAVRHDPGFGPARRALSELLMRAGRAGEAAELGE